jgi:hypothetical protein
MSLNYASIAKQVRLALVSVGMSVTFTRAGTTLFKTTGIFTASDETNVGGDQMSGITMTNTQKKSLMVPGTVKSAPQVGDYVVCKQGTFCVIDVKATNPAGTPLIYEVTVQ